jgi:hypothetical protein
MHTTSIPAFHVSGLSKAKGQGEVFISCHKESGSSHIFHLDMNVHFDPAVDNCPAGMLSIQTEMSNGAKGIFIASTFELINSYGRQDPTIYLTGMCKSDLYTGCRYWVMVVNNKKNNHRSPDIVGFCIHDSSGNRIAYGAGL